MYNTTSEDERDREREMGKPVQTIDIVSISVSWRKKPRDDERA